MSYFVPYIDASGIHLPTYEDRLQDLCSAYRTIFGQEAELSPAVPDYQLLSVIAKALDDTSMLVLSAFNAMNPAYASGQALDLLLPQYGISRNPGETDAEVRARLNRAMAGRGAFSLEAMEAAIREVPSVADVLVRVNETDSAVDGIPAHTIAALVMNGAASKIAEAIFKKKPPGIGTYGSMTKQVSDGRGNTVPISFSRPTILMIQFIVKVRAYDGFDQAQVQAGIQEALMQLVNGEMHIGQPINLPQLYGLLYRAAGDYASTFAVTDFYAVGAFETTREKIIPAWNQKFWMNAEGSVVIQVES